MGSYGLNCSVGSWCRLADMPISLGEICSVFWKDSIYVFGQGSSTTMKYSTHSNSWSTLAPRPYSGHHYTCHAIDNSIYLFGGLGTSSHKNVQIYHPQKNSWSSKSMPSRFQVGSACSAVIGNSVYIAGGITSHENTTDQMFKYSIASGEWSPLESMPDGGRNHAACGSDGIDLFVFGGRQGGNGLGRSLDQVFRYQVSSDSWSQVSTMRFARGGTGAAVWVSDRFFVFGGETNGKDQDVARFKTDSNVFPQVDAYLPSTGSWDFSTPSMMIPRHGIWPTLGMEKEIWVIGGGIKVGNSQSNVTTVFAIDSSPKTGVIPTVPSNTDADDSGVLQGSSASVFIFLISAMFILLQ